MQRSDARRALATPITRSPLAGPSRPRRRRDQRRCWLPLAGGVQPWRTSRSVLPSARNTGGPSRAREPPGPVGTLRRDLPDHDRRQSEQARAHQSALPSHGTGDRHPRDFNGDHGPTLSSSRFPRASSTGLTPTWSIVLIEFHGVDGLTPGESHTQGPQEVVATVLALTVPSSAAPGVGRPNLPRVTLRLGSPGAGSRWRRRPSVRI